MNHSEATELAGLYVLDALDPEERAAVDAHLASCTEAHEEFAELGAVAPALASLAEPESAPADLKNRVMADYRAGAAATMRQPAPQVRAPAPVIEMSRYRRPWLGWAAAAAAVLLIAVTAGWAYVAQSRANVETQRSELIAAAINVMAQPGSTVAFISGTGASPDSTQAHGFAAFPANGEGYLVMVGLPDAPAGQTYQAWYLVNGAATSAGLLDVDADGYAVLGDLSGLTGADLVALTIERAGGVDQPTGNPVAAGELRSNSAAS